MNSPLSTLLWFLVIVCLIPLTLWGLKRMPMLQGWLRTGTQTHPPVRIIATVTVGPQQRIITIETGQGTNRQWLVLGVTPHRITPLQSLTPDPEPFKTLMTQVHQGNTTEPTP